MERRFVVILIPFAAMALLSVTSIFLVRRRWQMDRAALRRAGRLVEPDIVTPPRDAPPVPRPWWGRPLLWIGVTVVFVVLGLVVWPGLLGGVFLFIPFVWVSRPRPPTEDPRSNGHARREGPV
jgi:hypothetical protein